MEWISILHKLPENSDEILILESGQHYHIGTYDEQLHEFDIEDDGILELDIVTHWMPLPDLPKK